MAEELKEQQEGQKSAGGQDGSSLEAQSEQSEKQAEDEEGRNEEDDGEDKEESDEEIGGREENNPRFNFVEIIFLAGLNLIGDLLELLDLSGFFIFVGLIVDFFTGPITIIYLWLKGIKGVVGKNAIAQVSEFIPLIDILPVRTTAIVLTIIATNHPEWIEKISGHSELIGKIAKKFK
ncbi:MAG: hypothetical protein KatS3mg098_142 [Candidatus Parcubacteria bacterium]|nr:MAG: hypothetical protein KatS3mg098_142 [Candidatus Parcubacteria bacterium]